MSLDIDISNYELYVMDYIEGELSQEDKAHFEAFLMKHSDVAMEVEELMDSDFSLKPIEDFQDKKSLKIEVVAIAGINESNYEEAMAASVDADINLGLVSDLDDFVEANPMLKRDLELYRATKLAPSNELAFAGKSNLKKPIPLFATSAGIYRIAAAVLVLFGIIGLLNTMQNEVHIPRGIAADYISLSVGAPMAIVPEATTKNNHTTGDNSAVKSLANRTYVPTMKRLTVSKKWAPQTLTLRESPSLALAVATEIPEALVAQNERSPELNITQFVGNELLGLAPEKPQTTRSLLKEGAIKVIDQSEQFALNTTSDDKNKKTFSLLAGAVEFKRVRYN